MVRIWSLSKSLVIEERPTLNDFWKIVTLGFGTIFGQVSFIQIFLETVLSKPQTSLIIIYGIGDLIFEEVIIDQAFFYSAYFWIWLVMQIILESAFIHRKTYFFWKGGQFQPSAFWTFLAESSNRSSTINALIMIFCILEAGGYFWGCLCYSSRFRRGKYLMVSKGKWQGHAAFTM